MLLEAKRRETETQQRAEELERQVKQAQEERNQAQEERNALMDKNKNIQEQHDRLKLLAETAETASSISKGTKKQPTSTSSLPTKKKVCCFVVLYL